jgi:hypothetical protein
MAVPVRLSVAPIMALIILLLYWSGGRCVLGISLKDLVEFPAV